MTRVGNSEGDALRALAAVIGPAASRTRFLGSCIRNAGAEPTTGSRVRRHGLTVANSFANGRKCFTELMFSSPLAWVVGPGIIRSETNAPHWVQRARFRDTFGVRSQKGILYGWNLRECGVGARLHGVLLLPVPDTGVKIAHASTDAFACAWTRRRYD